MGYSWVLSKLHEEESFSALNHFQNTKSGENFLIFILFWEHRAQIELDIVRKETIEVTGLFRVHLFVNPRIVAWQAPCPWNSPGKTNGVDWTQVSCIAGKFLPSETPSKPYLKSDCPRNIQLDQNLFLCLDMVFWLLSNSAFPFL